jgi:class 3 adenylate cyclase
MKAPHMDKDKADFRREIEEYYLPHQLVSAILESGSLPKDSTEAIIGIGFADIADYTWLSKFLSPSENQAVLNGLFVAFNLVLRKRHAYLNKIAGDSIMFHFGGPIDRHIRGLTPEIQKKAIAQSLFHTCVELQRICVLFNEANESFLRVAKDVESIEAMRKAFDIIRSLRTNIFIAQSINALYQIKVRIGASIGEVTIGSIGPKGVRHWDVIGIPVIQAKRMESTAPIGGLRISKDLFDILKATGVDQNYYQLFKEEATSRRGAFSDITLDELFQYRRVTIKEKSDGEFDTYSVQVDPLLPERIAKQAKLLLAKGEDGIDRIISFIQYYRGNRYIIAEIEKLFKEKEILVNKPGLLKLLDPRRYRKLYAEEGNDPTRSAYRIDRDCSLFNLLERLSRIQDVVKRDPRIVPRRVPFTDQNAYLTTLVSAARKSYAMKSTYIKRRAWFHNFLYPMTFMFFRAAMLEYQNRVQDVEA